MGIRHTTLAVAVCGVVQPLVGQSPGAPTWARDIAPILHEHCVSCHRLDGIAPFSLTTYADAVRRAGRIGRVTGSRFMPPWLPARNPDVRLAGERSLSPEQIDLIARWVESGAPEGDPADAPTAPAFPSEWQLGVPDLVVEFPEYQVVAEGQDIYRNLVAPVPVSSTVYVSSIEVRPGASRVVHHARLMVDTTTSSRGIAETDDRQPGFDGMRLQSNADNPPGHFAGWTPGRVPYRGSDEHAWPLAPGTDLVLQLHLRPSGEPETVKPRVGLFFAPRPPRRRPSLVMLGSESIDIPAGMSDYVVTDSYTIPVEVDVLGVYPHAHYLGKELIGLARLPDGSMRQLINIPDWDFNWQDEYRFAQPLSLPAGTTVSMRFTYDNSSGNPQNPYDPPQRVQYGSLSTDEMADLVIQVVARTERDREQLETDFAWSLYTKEVDRQIAAHLAAGDAALATGNVPQALDRYRAAQMLKADDPEVHNALGTAMVRAGDAVTARLHLEQATRLAPDWPVPLTTLATIALRDPDPDRRDPDEAIRYAARAAGLTDRSDPAILEILAVAYLEAGRVDRAEQTLEEAIGLAQRQGLPDLQAQLRDRLDRLRIP